MGFEAGFTVYPRFKNYSFNDVKTVLSYKNYIDNSWCKEHDIKFEDYVKDNGYDANVDILDDGDFDEACEFYKDFNEYEASINFCSEFRYIDDEILILLGLLDHNTCYHELSKDNIKDLLKFADNRIEDLPIYSIRRAYTYDDENEDTFKSFPIDGVELWKADSYTRADVNCDYEPSFIMADDGGYMYDTSVRLYHTLYALNCIDLKNNHIIYYRSY